MPTAPTTFALLRRSACGRVLAWAALLGLLLSGGAEVMLVASIAQAGHHQVATIDEGQELLLTLRHPDGHHHHAHRHVEPPANAISEKGRAHHRHADHTVHLCKRSDDAELIQSVAGHEAGGPELVVATFENRKSAVVETGRIVPRAGAPPVCSLAVVIVEATVRLI